MMQIIRRRPRPSILMIKIIAALVGDRIVFLLFAIENLLSAS